MAAAVASVIFSSKLKTMPQYFWLNFDRSINRCVMAGSPRKTRAVGFCNW